MISKQQLRETQARVKKHWLIHPDLRTSILAALAELETRRAMDGETERAKREASLQKIRDETETFVKRAASYGTPFLPRQDC